MPLQRYNALDEGRPHHGRAPSGIRSGLAVHLFNRLFARDDTVKMRSDMQADWGAYTSESRAATSPTRSRTTGVIGAKDGVLVIDPAAAGPWPLAGTVIFTTRRVWREG